MEGEPQARADLPLGLLQFAILGLEIDKEGLGVGGGVQEFGVQQQLVDFMLKHDLKDRYYRIDTSTSAEHARDLGLDVATEHAQGTLIALAEGCYQRACTAPQVLEALAHQPIKPDFVRG